MAVSFLVLLFITLLASLAHPLFSTTIPSQPTSLITVVAQYTPLIPHRTNTTYEHLHQANIFIPLTVRSLIQDDGCPLCEAITRIRSISAISKKTGTENKIALIAVTALVQLLDSESFDPLLHQTKFDDKPELNEGTVLINTPGLNWGSSIYVYKLPVYITLQVLFSFAFPGNTLSSTQTKFVLEFRGTSSDPLLLETQFIPWLSAATTAELTTRPSSNVIISQIPSIRRTNSPPHLQHSETRVILDPYRLGRFHFSATTLPATISASSPTKPFSIKFALVGSYQFVTIKEPFSHILNNHSGNDHEDENNPSAQYHFIPHHDREKHEAILTSQKPFCLINNWFPYVIPTDHFPSYDLTLTNLSLDQHFAPPRYKPRTLQFKEGNIPASIVCYNIAVAGPMGFPSVPNTPNLYPGLNVAVTITNYAQQSLIFNFNTPESKLFLNIAPSSFNCLMLQMIDQLIRCVYYNPFEDNVGAMTMMLVAALADFGFSYTLATVFQFGSPRHGKEPIAYLISDLELFQTSYSSTTLAYGTWNNTLDKSLIQNRQYYDPTIPIVIDIVSPRSLKEREIRPFTIYLNSTAIPTRFVNAEGDSPRFPVENYIPYTFYNAITSESSSDLSSIDLYADEFKISLQKMSPSTLTNLHTDQRDDIRSNLNLNLSNNTHLGKLNDPFVNEDGDQIFYLIFPQRLLQFHPLGVNNPRCGLYMGIWPQDYNFHNRFLYNATFSFLRFTNDLTFDIRDTVEVFSIESTDVVDDDGNLLKSSKAQNTDADTSNKYIDAIKVTGRKAFGLNEATVSCTFGVAYNPVYSHDFSRVPNPKEDLNEGVIPIVVFAALLEHTTLSITKANFLLENRVPGPEPTHFRLIMTTVLCSIAVSILLALIIRYVEVLRGWSKRLFPCCYSDYSQNYRKQQYIKSKVAELNDKTMYSGGLPVESQAPANEADSLQSHIDQIAEVIQHRDANNQLLQYQILEQTVFETLIDHKDPHNGSDFDLSPSQPFIRKKKGVYQ